MKVVFGKQILELVTHVIICPYHMKIILLSHDHIPSAVFHRIANAESD